MDIFNSVEVLGAVALGLVIGMIILLFLQAKSSHEISKLTYPAYEFTIKKAQNSADEIIAKAQEQARAIIAKAEEESGVALKARSEESEANYKAYLESFESLRATLTASLASTVEETENQSRELSEMFVAHLREQDEDMQKKIANLSEQFNEIPTGLLEQSNGIVENLRERVARAGEQLEHALISAHEKNQAEIEEHFQKGFSEAERDIELYREGRKRLIDRQIETLVKDVVRETLKRELSRSDHAELVREALIEARSAGAV